jgi:hypothetical protein
MRVHATAPSTRVCVLYLRETYVMCIFVQNAWCRFSVWDCVLSALS